MLINYQRPRAAPLPLRHEKTDFFQYIDTNHQRPTIRQLMTERE